MTRRHLLGALAAGAAGLALVGCNTPVEDIGFIWQTPYYAKLKVEVDTPEGVRSGFSVIEVKWAKSNQSFHVRGEAVAVDLPGGQTLFALLRSSASVDWAAYVHENVNLEGDVAADDDFYRRIAADRAVWPVKRRQKVRVDVIDNYPIFVRFRDLRDPKSVEQVNPDDLAATFGKGFALKSLTVQMTDEPVTVGIEKRLAVPFWQTWGAIHKREMDKGSINANPYFSSFSAQLNRDDFIKELTK